MQRLSFLPRFIGPSTRIAAFWALTATTSGVWLARNSQAAPKSSADATLSFRMTARFTARDDGKAVAGPAQTFDGRVFLKGNKARIETQLSDRPVLFLYSPPYLYKLLPEERAGVRWRTDKAQPQGWNTAQMNRWLRQPASLRSELKKRGARPVSSTQLGGVPVEVWTWRNAGKNSIPATAGKVWLRRSDGLPVRLETTSPSLSATVSWRDYARKPLAENLFRAPTGYSIRDSKGAPRLM